MLSAPLDITMLEVVCIAITSFAAGVLVALYAS